MTMQNKLYFTTKNITDITPFIAKERQTIGFYDLPEIDVQPYLDYAKQTTAKDIVIVGIGGSALGTSAVYEFIQSVRPLDKKIHILDTTDPIVLKNKLGCVELNDALFIVISKSGTTVETIAALKYLVSLVPISDKNYCVVTDPDSKLEKFAMHHKLKVFNLDKNVGGRFSVLSAVGLLPLAIVGVDIKALLEGAKKIKNAFFDDSEYCTKIMEKATYYAQHANTYNINCLFSYAESFRQFNAWYVQLWGESLGKKQLKSELHVGLTPVGLIGPTDQHSFLQLIVEGKRDKSVTVIKVKNFENEVSIPDITLEHIEALDVINNLSFSKLINMQADSIIESLDQLDDIPLDVIEIDKIDEHSMGMMMYYYELLTALIGKMLGINAFDQPGVEMGKKILKEKLKA